ncbi:putative pol-like 37, partial [Homarus americanus]
MILTEKMQEDQTPKTPQLQMEQTTPLRQISDKRKNLPSKRSLKTVKPQAPRNRSRGIEQQTQTVSKHTITGKSDNTLKREEKTPAIPPITSRIPPPVPPLEQVPKITATNEHTIPNERGGERLNHERREQLQHRRRGDNDRIAPPPCHLKITQWNVQGLSNKRHTVQAVAIAKNIDVFILQETLMSWDKQFRLPEHQQYSVPKGPNSHGNMILDRATIPSSEVEPAHYGDGVEAQAVRIHLANDSLVVYNIYKPPTKRLEAGELLTQATQELKIRENKWLEWCAAFNAHTSLRELWRKLRVATGKLPRVSAHPQPLQEANRLAEHFALRSSSAQLPPEIRLHLQQVQLVREVVVRHAIKQTDTTDCLFTTEEIRRARKTSKDTAHGSDDITYSLLSNAGLAGKIPPAWKRANIVPIPKPNDPQNFIPISLTACIGKTADRVILTRLLWKTGPLHHNIFGFTKDVFNKKTWLLYAADAVNRLELKDTILSKGPDTMSPDYSTPAPWESPPAVINILQTGTRKAD